MRESLLSKDKYEQENMKYSSYFATAQEGFPLKSVEKMYSFALYLLNAQGTPKHKAMKDDPLFKVLPCLINICIRNFLLLEKGKSKRKTS